MLMPGLMTDSVIQDAMPLKVVDVSRIISEDDAGVSRPALRLTGIFQRADDINTNGRVYPLGVLKEAVESIQDQINGRAIMGEFDHPKDAKIHMDRVSHLLTKLWLEGKIVYGQIEVLEEMPCGKMLKVLIESNVQVSVSSRGVGDMKTKGLEEGKEAYEVLPGYQLVTFDAVAEPSVTGTQLSVMESRERAAQQVLDEQRKKEREALKAIREHYLIK